MKAAAAARFATPSSHLVDHAGDIVPAVPYADFPVSDSGRCQVPWLANSPSGFPASCAFGSIQRPFTNTMKVISRSAAGRVTATRSGLGCVASRSRVLPSVAEFPPDCLGHRCHGWRAAAHFEAFRQPFLAGVQGDIPRATALVEEGRTLAGQTPDPLPRAHVALADGYLTLFGGDLPDNRTTLEDAISVFTEQGYLLFHVIALGILGMLHDLRNDTEQAIECLERVIAITEARGESVYRSYMVWALAVAVWRHGNRARAIPLLRQALQLDRLVNDRLNASICLQVLAWITAEENNARRAVVLMGAAEALSRSVGSPTVVLPKLHVHQDECERRTRRALGEHAFAASHKEGAALNFDAAVTYALGEQIRPTATSAGSSSQPTKREREVAELIAEGLTNKEIAARLVISPRTAQGHVEHLLTKLRFTSRAQIAAWVVESKTHQS